MTKIRNAVVSPPQHSLKNSFSTDIVAESSPHKQQIVSTKATTVYKALIFEKLTDKGFNKFEENFSVSFSEKFLTLARNVKSGFYLSDSLDIREASGITEDAAVFVLSCLQSSFGRKVA